MKLGSGGLATWYVDESGQGRFFAVTAIEVPLLREREGVPTFEWQEWLDKLRNLRGRLSAKAGIPVRKELHASKLLSGHGRYLKRRQLTRHEGVVIYKRILGSLGCLPPESVITVAGRGPAQLYGETRIRAAFHALFQRMQRRSESLDRNGITFFDEGHPEYRRMYRRARVFLMTGSRYGPATNRPMVNFVKDTSFKQSHECLFTQVADLIAYAALQRAKHRAGALESWRTSEGLQDAYAKIPKSVLNLKVNESDPCGIKWLEEGP